MLATTLQVIGLALIFLGVVNYINKKSKKFEDDPKRINMSSIQDSSDAVYATDLTYSSIASRIYRKQYVTPADYLLYLLEELGYVTLTACVYSFKQPKVFGFTASKELDAVINLTPPNFPKELFEILVVTKLRRDDDYSINKLMASLFLEFHIGVNRSVFKAAEISELTGIFKRNEYIEEVEKFLRVVHKYHKERF